MQDHPVGLADALAVLGEIFIRKPEHGQGERRLLFVENTHDDFLTILHRAGGHAKVDIHVFLGVFFENDTTVLRQPALGNVEVAHDLDARDEAVGDLLGQAQFFHAKTVDAVAHEEFFLHGLDVNVGRAADVGVFDDAIGELDDRSGVIVF